MKLLELFAMDGEEGNFDPIGTNDAINPDNGVTPIRKEKDKPQGARRRDARQIAVRLRWKANNQGSADKELNSETPENSPFSSSGMR